MSQLSRLNIIFIFEVTSFAGQRPYIQLRPSPCEQCFFSCLRRGPSQSFAPSIAFSDKAHVKSLLEYEQLHAQSINAPDTFWSQQANELDWFKKWDTVFSWQDKAQSKFTWFSGGQLNVCYNCVDRHIAQLGDKTAIIWQGDREDDVRFITYRQLHEQVCRCANVLTKYGITKGNRVCIYLPMIPEAAIAMLACARIGAIHSVVFGGFSGMALKNRIQDCQAKMLITADGGMRGGKIVPLKEIADQILPDCPSVQTVLVVRHTSVPIATKLGRDVDWHTELSQANTNCLPVSLEANEPLFILYTSGTTGKPKGLLHAIGGYLLYVQQTFKYVFDYHSNDVYWCTADVGWITGHSYVVYGPLANGATIVMYEGIPTYPASDRFWHIIEKFKVSTFYTAPTAIRSLITYGDEFVRAHDLSSLRLLGTVGEPINPEPWLWYYHTIGGGRCPIVDTWWQTETGGIMIAPLPGAMKLKPSSASKPFFGVQPAIVDDFGRSIDAGSGGYLVITRPWPGLARTVWGGHQRYIDVYWARFPGMYFTGDAARVDSDGDYFLMGRVDDVIKVSGHRLGSAEIESALVSYPAVAEAAVVPIPHAIKGEALYAFVTLKNGVVPSPQLADELRIHVGHVMGPTAKPDKIQFAPTLPKTRSGKIVRRILKAIAQGTSDFGDTSTLVDPGVIKVLLETRRFKL